MDYMLFNPAVAMLKNEATSTWHPILFVESPLSGPYSPDKPVRHKSKGHHTEGFPTRKEALEDARGLAEKAGATIVELDTDIPWDGNGIPAIVHCFGQSS